MTAADVTIQGLTVSGSYSTSIWAAMGADRVQILKNKVDQTGFDPGALAGVTWDGSAIQTHGKNTVINGNKVKFGPSSRPHNGINVLLVDQFDVDTVEKNSVTIFEGPKYQVGINVRETTTVAHNKVKCPDKTIGGWTKVFGIWLYYAGSPAAVATVQKNHVTKTDYAIWVTGSSAKWTLIERNKLDNNMIGVIFEGGATGVELNDNKVSKSWWADYLVN